MPPGKTTNPTPPLTLAYRSLYTKYTAIYGPNTAILMQVGVFYELYDILNPETQQPYTNIKRATQILNIVLKEKAGGIFDAGFPDFALHKFAQTLTREGWTVVIVDQVRDGMDQVKGRETARILSPGTHVELAGEERMTVAVLWINQGTQAAAVVDLTTGEVFSHESANPDDILHMLQVYAPREVVVHSSGAPPADVKARFALHGLVHHAPQEQTAAIAALSTITREDTLRSFFRVRGLLPVAAALDLDLTAPTASAILALLRFLEDHFPQTTTRLTRHTPFTPTAHMRIGTNLLEQLGVIGQGSGSANTLLALLDRTHSAIGRRNLRERMLRPITDPSELETRWSEVAWCTHLPDPDSKTINRILKSLYDIPRLHYRFAEGRMTATDAIQAAQTYAATAALSKLLAATPLPAPPGLPEFRATFAAVVDEDKARRAQNDEPTGFLTAAAGPRSAAIETQIADAHATWDTTWRAFARNVGLSPDSFHLEGKSDSWTWEGPRSLKKTLDGHIATGKSTLVGLLIEYKASGPISLRSHEFDAYVATLRRLTTQLTKVSKEEVATVCDGLWAAVAPIQDAWIGWIGRLDSTLALAAVATEYGWTRPQLSSEPGQGFQACQLQHPLLTAAPTRLENVAHDVTFDDAHSGWLVYGVNASGKSTLMKSIGLAVLLAQTGSFVPAASLRLRPFDAAFTRIWNRDSLSEGLSSFAVEMTELRGILTHATAHSLVLGDEVCSGTESASGTAIVAATLEHLDRLGTTFVFATHLHELAKLIDLFPHTTLLHLRVRREAAADGGYKLIYDRTLQPGAGTSLYGLEVARAMGLPTPLMDRAASLRRRLAGESALEDAPASSWNSDIRRRACEVCGCPLQAALEVHHIQARADGGGNQARNLAVLCTACHDKHHSGEITVGPLRLTSDGIERESVLSTPTSRVTKASTWNDEELELIQVSIRAHPGAPAKRILLDLCEKGLRITAAQLRRFMV
jgi:DNA mismatch repair protein MutS